MFIFYLIISAEEFCTGQDAEQPAEKVSETADDFIGEDWSIDSPELQSCGEWPPPPDSSGVWKAISIWFGG